MKKVQEVAANAGTADVDRFAWLDASERVHRARVVEREKLRDARPDMPVRKPPKYDGQLNYHGHYWHAGAGTLIWHESMAEYAMLMLLDHQRTIRHVWPQPFVITFGGGVKQHVPDYLIEDDQGRRALLNMHAEALMTEANEFSFARTGEACAELGWEHLLYSELPDLVVWNLEMVARYRHPRYAPDSGHRQWVLAQVAANPRYGELRQALKTARPGEHIPALRHLMWSRAVTFSLTTPFSDNSVLEVA